MDAYGQSIIFPSVGNAEKEISIFKEWVKTGDIDFIPPDEKDAIVDAEVALGRTEDLRKYLAAAGLSILESAANLQGAGAIDQALSAQFKTIADDTFAAACAVKSVPNMEPPYLVSSTSPLRSCRTCWIGLVPISNGCSILYTNQG